MQVNDILNLCPTVGHPNKFLLLFIWLFRCNMYLRDNSKHLNLVWVIYIIATNTEHHNTYKYKIELT